VTELLQNYFPQLEPSQVERLTQLKSIYTHWNNQINVVSRKDIDDFNIHHVLHSLSMLKYISFEPNSKIMDLGCGGGFPGIPLAIAFPEVEFLLVDSIGKKIKVVNEISKEIGIQNIRTIHGRAEDVNSKFDFVISRAVAPLESLLKWTYKKYLPSSNHVLQNGLICLKGGDLHEEIALAHAYLKQQKMQPDIRLHAIFDWFNEPFFETKKLVYVKM
jgi:16S rRNA (guanine527-N7)-methyltransferase